MITSRKGARQAQRLRLVSRGMGRGLLRDIAAQPGDIGAPGASGRLARDGAFDGAARLEDVAGLLRGGRTHEGAAVGAKLDDMPSCSMPRAQSMPSRI